MLVYQRVIAMNVHFECWSLISVWAPKKTI